MKESKQLPFVHSTKGSCRSLKAKKEVKSGFFQSIPLSQQLVLKIGVENRIHTLNCVQNACQSKDDHTDTFQPDEGISNKVKGVRAKSLFHHIDGLLGSGTLWSDLYEANTDIVHTPDLIYPGQVLVIPTH